MRILMTGSTGFIGSALYPKLIEREHKVWELVRYVSGGRYDFYDKSNRLFADLRDRDAVRRAVLEVKPDVLIHLAAQSAVSWSFTHPEEVTSVNLAGTQALADALLELGRGHFVHASTSEVYGRVTKFPTPESEPLSATSPYAVSKIAAEEYLRVLHQTQGLPITIVRPFNTYGRALVGNRHFVVERAITQALTTGMIKLHDPRPERDFVFREDHVRGYLHVLEHLDKTNGEAINLTSGKCWSIRGMAETVALYVEGYQKHRFKALTDFAPRITVEFSEVPDRPLDIDKLQGNNTKARELIKWVPGWSFSAGIRRAVEEWAAVLTN